MVSKQEVIEMSLQGLVMKSRLSFGNRIGTAN